MMENTVETPSLDHEAMAYYWRNVSSVLSGTSAMRERTDLLPKFDAETDADYTFRRKHARFTNVWRDIVENLAAKPFAEELTIDETLAERDPWRGYVENMDGEGNNLHVFGGDVFFNQLAYSLHWVFVDFPKAGDGQTRTVAQERAANMRPYCLSIKAKDVLSVETSKIGGIEVITHCRFRANAVEREGYKQVTKHRIREYNREGDAVSYKVHEKQKNAAAIDEWVVIDEGVITLQEIPLVPFVGGRVKHGFVVEPMLRDALDLQIELFWQENGLKYAKDNTAFPMLAGNGVAPPMGPDGNVGAIQVGPKSVLYAPPSADSGTGGWAFIEPSATSLRFLADDIKETVQNLRELGRQPLTAQTGNLTVVTTAMAAQKGNSAVQAAALIFKDAMENVFRIMGAWIGESDGPEVLVFSDFDVNLSGDQDLTALIKARENRDISREAFLAELKRRAVLRPEYDAEEDMALILGEVPADEEQDQDLLDATARA